MAHFRDPSVGLVSHLVRGIGAKTLGARLENQHLNSFILPSVSLLDRMFGMPCVVGKSMLMRREDLEAMGGLASVKDYLAEDYVLGETFRKACWGTALPLDGSFSAPSATCWREVFGSPPSSRKTSSGGGGRCESPVVPDWYP